MQSCADLLHYDIAASITQSMLCAGMVAGCMGDGRGRDFQRNAAAPERGYRGGGAKEINRLTRLRSRNENAVFRGRALSPDAPTKRYKVKTSQGA